MIQHNPAVFDGPCSCSLCVPLVVRRDDAEAAEAVRRQAHLRTQDTRLGVLTDQLRRSTEGLREARRVLAGSLDATG